jgi:uncharacterized protein
MSEKTPPRRRVKAVDLSASEIRVLACLLEKQRTTPDIYPLTLNALRMACNQSTNRDPVVDYDDGVIREALHRLERRGFTRLASGRGSRAPKYRHLLAETLPMSEDEYAVICVLMLRGPQTPGELKQRAERMHPFAGLDAVQDTLARLIERGLGARLERRPGQKEERYTQLLEDRDAPERSDRGEPDSAPANPVADGGAPDLRSVPSGAGLTAPAPVAGARTDLHERVARLEREVAELHLALGMRAGRGESAGDGGRAGAVAGSTVGDPPAQDRP